MGAKTPINLSNLNISQVIENKKERQKATYVIDNNSEEYYLYCGKKVGVKDFEMAFPIEIIHNNPKGLNVDGTHVK